MKNISRLFFTILLFMLFTNVNALEVKTGTIYRSSATIVKINFLSDTDGKYYYEVTNSSDIPNNIISSGIYGGTITKDTITQLNLSNLTSGKKYIHILVTDDINQDIKTVELPYDFYYNEDFEIYTVDQYPSFFTIKYNGSGNSNQKVITTTQKNNLEGKVFNLSGKSGWASDQRIPIDIPIEDGILIYEADIKLIVNHPGAFVLGNSNISGWVGSLASVHFDDGLLKHGIGDQLTETNNDKSYNQGGWVRAKIFLDLTNKKFDYYIDGEKINTEHIDTISNYGVNYIGVASGNYTNSDIVYFDNLKVYNAPGSIFEHNISINNTNGTIITNKTSATVYTEITISNIIPSEGYQLENIKIQKASDKSDITDLVNYNSTSKTFIMPDYDVEITPTFEEIPNVINDIEKTDNPQTSDYIILNILISCITLISLVGLSSIKKRIFN